MKPEAWDDLEKLRQVRKRSNANEPIDLAQLLLALNFALPNEQVLKEDKILYADEINALDANQIDWSYDGCW